MRDGPHSQRLGRVYGRGCKGRHAERTDAETDALLNRALHTSAVPHASAYPNAACHKPCHTDITFRVVSKGTERAQLVFVWTALGWLCSVTSRRHTCAVSATAEQLDGGCTAGRWIRLHRGAAAESHAAARSAPAVPSRADGGAVLRGESDRVLLRLSRA